MRRFILILGLLVAGPAGAQAHAFLDHADPPVGCTVHAPRRVTIWFNRDIEGGSSEIQVFDAQGKEVDRRDSKLDPAEHKKMSVSLPPLAPGCFTVVWNAVALDLHHTHGTYPFTVAP